jgi:ribonuclease PH
MPRSRPPDRLREIRIVTGFLPLSPPSVLYNMGSTSVLCTASLQTGVPPFLEGRGKGWATAEYDMLPGSTNPRHPRERGGKISGRTQEIQRMIGRALRGILDLSALDGWTLQIDCDVLQADGGTRTASINGAYVATAIAVGAALRRGHLARDPVTDALGAVSAGIVRGERLLDLDYADDSAADVDLNLVLTGSGALLEIQAASEGSAFSREDLDGLVDLARGGISRIIDENRRAARAAVGP